MASYQNSAGNKGVSTEYGQWRYFNSSIKRLGEYSNARLNTRVLDYVPKQEVDWMKTITSATRGALGLFEMRRRYSYKKADDWLSKHSLKEYHQLMKDGNVPFQDDPLAMQRLKFRHGEILADIAQNDFQSRIDKGEFIGKEPEEIDAENFKYMQKVLSEDTDIYPYKADGDWFFNQGFWANSNKFRQQVFDKSKAVDDSYMKDQAVLEAKASIDSMIESGESPEKLVMALGSVATDYGYHLRNSDLDDIYKSAFARASTKPYGRTYIESLADKKMPNADITFREYFGNDYIEKLIVDADNLKLRAEGDEYYSFRTKVNSLASSPDGMPELKRMLDAELKVNGNEKTDKTDILYEAIESAEKNANTLLKQSQRDKEKTASMLAMTDYYDQVVAGNENIPTEEAKINEWGNTTANDRKLAQQMSVNKVLSSGSPVRINTMLTSITKDGRPTELKTYTADILKNLYSGTSKAIDEYLTKGSLPNSSTEGAVMYTREDGTNIGYVPSDFSTFMQIYNINPSAVASLMRNDTSFKSDMDLANMAIDMGRNPVEVLAKKRKFEEDLKLTARTSGTPVQNFNTAVRKEMIYGLSKDAVSNTQLAGLNDTLSGIVKSTAVGYNIINPSEGFGKSISAARKLVEREVAGICTFVIPKSILFSGFSGISLSDSSKKDIIDIANDVFVKIAKESSDVKDSKDYDRSIYDSSRNEIRVIGLDGKLHGIIPINAFAKRIREEFDSNNR